MTTQELKKGVDMLYDMEVNHYLMTRAIQSLDREIHSLANRRPILSPQKREYKNRLSDFIVPACFASILFFTFFGVVSCVTSSGYANVLLYAILGVFLGVIGGLLLFAVDHIIDKHRIEKEYRNADDIFMGKLAGDIVRIERETEQKRHLLKQRAILKERLDKSKAIAMTMYAKMGIDREYRHMIAIGYMNEFLRLGIANRLGGADGLYYLVRKEIKMDVMQSTMIEISEKLDMLVDQQRELHRDLLQINRKCDNMVDMTVKAARSAGAIAENTAVTAYNTERIQRELEFQNFMLLLS